jgi:hypothetical protein
VLLLGDRPRLLEPLPQLLDARILHRRLAKELAVEGDRGTRRAGQPRRPGSHSADATLPAFLPRLAPFAPELRLPARPPETEGREASGA